MHPFSMLFLTTIKSFTFLQAATVIRGTRPSSLKDFLLLRHEKSWGQLFWTNPRPNKRKPRIWFRLWIETSTNFHIQGTSREGKCMIQIHSHCHFTLHSLSDSRIWVLTLHVGSFLIASKLNPLIQDPTSPFHQSFLILERNMTYIVVY